MSFLYQVIHAKSLKLETNIYHWFVSTMTFLQVLNTIETMKWLRSYKGKWMLSASGVPYNPWNSHGIAYLCAEWSCQFGRDDHLGDVP